MLLLNLLNKQVKQSVENGAFAKPDIPLPRALTDGTDDGCWRRFAAPAGRHPRRATALPAARYAAGSRARCVVTLDAGAYRAAAAGRIRLQQQPVGRDLRQQFAQRHAAPFVAYPTGNAHRQPHIRALRQFVRRSGKAVHHRAGQTRNPGFSTATKRSWASRQCRNTGICSSAASASCASNAYSCCSCAEKLRLKSSPHSPMATTCGYSAGRRSVAAVSADHSLA